ncbi:VWA domain-containing protein [Agromyces protaetiae]|uniref:VWA domain-containing protein n=1 Tax=Agromyces protaetiae TaxID=2509455 RepID=A0A4P6FVJ7_9MICO|nr:VWA domain-containing protein [Agromyces protaetiae]QAY74628.1 VWA domain-containing protein [Agromyces protaetiae]
MTANAAEGDPDPTTASTTSTPVEATQSPAEVPDPASGDQGGTPPAAPDATEGPEQQAPAPDPAPEATPPAADGDSALDPLAVVPDPSADPAAASRTSAATGSAPPALVESETSPLRAAVSHPPAVDGIVKPNPDLADSCGVDIALVLDASGSIESSGIAQLKAAANTFADSLVDTGSQISVTAFATDAAQLLPATNLDSANLAAVKGSWSILSSGGYTNWARGLQVGYNTFGGFADGQVDLVIVISDGQPNTVNPANPGEFGDGSFEALWPPIQTANAMKSGGTKVFAVGVGPRVSPLSLQAITGPQLFTGSNIATADYATTTNYATLGDQLHEIAVALCGGTVFVHKDVDGVPAAGWRFDAKSADVSPVSQETEAGGVTDPYYVSGYGEGHSSRSVTFDEKQKPGYSLEGVVCKVGGPHGPNAPSQITGESSFSVEVGKTDVVHCYVSNGGPPRDVSIEKSAELAEGVEAVEVGDEFTWVLTVTNGDVAVDDLEVVDAIDPQLEVIGAAQFTTVPAVLPGTWAQTSGPTDSAFAATYTGEFPAGATTTIRIPVRVLPVPALPTPPAVGPDDPAPPVPTLDVSPIPNEACVSTAKDENPENDCATADVPIKRIQPAAYVRCVNDVPWLYFDVTVTDNVAPGEITVTWTSADGSLTKVETVPWDARSGRLLWPGAAVDENGIPYEFPGWRPITEQDLITPPTPGDRFLDLILDETVPTYPWRDMVNPATITFSINPSESVLAAYPMALPTCAIDRPEVVNILKSSSVTSAVPGSSFEYTLSTTATGTGAAENVTLFDEIPADLRVDEITTAGAPAFPRYENCAVTGQDAAGYGGTLRCDLLGVLGQNYPTAPDVVLAVTLNPRTTASSETNTGELCYVESGDVAAQVLCDESTVVVRVPHGMPATGFAGGPWVWGAAGLIVLGGIAVVYTITRRRKDGTQVE